MDPDNWGRRVPFSRVFLCFVRVCVLLKEMVRRLLLDHGIRSSPPSLRSDGASDIVGGRVEVCLRRILRDPVGGCVPWICLDLIFIRLCSCIYKLNPSNLYFSSSATIAVLVRWSFGILARRLPACLLQKGLPGSMDGGLMTVARLRLVLVLIVVAMWSTDLDVIFIASRFFCTALIVDE